MMEEIKRKIDNYEELSIEELKILYQIDGDIDIELFGYTNKRDNKTDLRRIFGDKVAFSAEEITEDTVYLYGDLFIPGNKNIYPTYNLKYISGILHFEGEELNRLENLEKVLYSIELPNLKNTDSLPNLVYVNYFILHEKNDTENFILPENVFEIDYTGITLKHIILPDTLVIFDAEIENDNDLKVELPVNLKILELNYLTNSSKLLSDLPPNLEYLFLENLNDLTSYDKVKLPDNLLLLEMDSLSDASKLILPTTLTNLKLNSVKTKNNLPDISHLSNLEELYLKDFYDDIKLPPNITSLQIELLPRVIPETLTSIEITSSFIKDYTFPKVSENANIMLSAETLENVEFPETVDNIIFHSASILNNVKLPIKCNDISLPSGLFFGICG